MVVGSEVPYNPDNAKCGSRKIVFDLKAFLEQEVVPALGCTEPGAIALAVARACDELPTREEISRIEIIVSHSVYKNGFAASLPGGVEGIRGIAMAAALAVYCGRPEYGLEVLQDCRVQDVQQAAKLVENHRVNVTADPAKHGVYVEATVATLQNTATVIIEGDHSRITKVVKNGTEIYCREATEDTNNEPSVIEAISEMRYADLWGLAEAMDADDVDYLMRGVEMNRAIAEVGLDGERSLDSAFGQALQRLIAQGAVDNDLAHRIRGYCYAACDARMAGIQLPVMSSAGSGNHGITAILPVALLVEKLGKTRKDISKAVLISHLTTSFIKARLGRLSPVCGCTVAAGAGAAAGMASLLGGGLPKAVRAIETILANTAGMICDGAKPTCALKVGTAAHEAYLAALFAVRANVVNRPQGVVGHSLEETVANLSLINQQGMRDVDQLIIRFLEACDQTTVEDKAAPIGIDPSVG